MGKRKTEPAEKPWNPGPRVRAFLAAYRTTASVTRAAKAAGITRWAHYRLLERNPGYRNAFDRAAIVAADALEDEAIRRAREGIVRQVLYHGMPAMELKDPNDPDAGLKARLEREYSDTLLLALLKAKKPKEYRERFEHELGPETARKFEGTMEDLLCVYRLLTAPKKEES